VTKERIDELIQELREITSLRPVDLMRVKAIVNELEELEAKPHVAVEITIERPDVTDRDKEYTIVLQAGQLDGLNVDSMTAENVVVDILEQAKKQGYKFE